MKISARDILVFVAGALAWWGARALLYLPYYFFAPEHNAAWFGRLVYSSSAALDLPLGLAILFGRRWAILLTQFWLWLTLAFAVFVACRSAVVIGLSKALSYVWLVWPDLMLCLVLLLLIQVSRSRKFQASLSV